MSAKNLYEYEEYDGRLSDETPFAMTQVLTQRNGKESFESLSEDELSFGSPFHLEDTSEMPAQTESEPGAPPWHDHASESAGSYSELQTATESFSNPAAQRDETNPDGIFEVDPYAAIRSVLSPEHANLPAEEVTLTLGHLPASFVLHQLLNSPELQQATVATILGSGARRSVRVHGSDVPIPAYLRMLSRLCGEVAEQSETPKTSLAAASHATVHHVPLGPPPEVAGFVLGVDLFEQNPLTAAGVANLSNHGKLFAIAKSSQGTHPDGQFTKYYRLIRDGGMIRGSYHFLSNKRSTNVVFGGTIERQAQTVLSLVTRLAPGDLAPALDLEDEPRKPAGRYPLDQGLHPGEQGYNYRHTQTGRNELLRDIQDFLDRIETALGRTPIIYTSRMWSDSDMLGNPHVMSQYPLWTVWHAGALSTLSLGGWGRDWDIVQYGEQGGNWRGINPYNEPNINIGGLDFNAYHGTAHGLRGLADMGRPAIAFGGNTCFIAHSDVDDSLHLLTGAPWTDRNITRLSSQRDLSGSDPAMVASLGGVFLYYRRQGHLLEAANSLAGSGNWQVHQIEDVQAPVHDPRAILNGNKRHVVYWGADDDWYVLNWDNGWSSSGSVLTLAGIKTAANRGQSSGQPTIYVANGIVHLAGRVGSEGHLYDVWFEGTGWKHADLTALARTLSPNMPAATYSPCAYQTSSGVSIAFRAVGGSLWVVNRTTNAATNLTADTHATLAAGHPTCFVVNDEPHVVYRGSDKFIYDLSLRGGAWRVQQVCPEKTATDPVATNMSGSGLAALRMMDGSIHLARFNGAVWTCTPTA